MTPLVVVLGPTAVGKSALAVDLAEALGGEIINADALQVYRGFDVGTSKPSASELARVPHHLVDILDPGELYSAGDFARRARQAIIEIRRRHHLPIVVGGSGFYLRALLEPLSPIPAVPPAVRVDLRRRLADEGLETLRAELARADPETAERLAPGDTQRILRALEVLEATSRTLSSWTRSESEDRNLKALKVGLTLPRGLLYDRIAARVERMLAAGWGDEVRALLASGLSGDEPAFQAIGYRQLIDYVEGRRELVEAVGDIVLQTRRYAKRQLTWFRQDAGTTWYEAVPDDRLFQRVHSDLESALEKGERQ